jgi:hypothetical protein
MLDQFLVGGIVSISNIIIHALVMTTVVRATRSVGAKKTLHPSLLLISVMTTVVSVLMAAHTSEVFVWSLAYLIVDAVPVGTNLVYFAFVNYTTLGYGDVTPVQDWQLLGPMTANELSAVIWVVDRCHLRGAAENNDARLWGAGISVEGGHNIGCFGTVPLSCGVRNEHAD